MPPAYLRAPSMNADPQVRPACTAAPPKGKRRHKPCQKCGLVHALEAQNAARAMLLHYAGQVTR